jgi:hypothetical protein
MMERPLIRYVGQWVGALSLASGLALVAAPRAVGNGYGLPESDALRRWLGARDVAIGLGMLFHRGSAASWWIGRTLSDAVDVAMILRNVRRNGSVLARDHIKGLGGLLVVGIELGCTILAARTVRS